MKYYNLCKPFTKTQFQGMIEVREIQLHFMYKAEKSSNENHTVVERVRLGSWATSSIPRRLKTRHSVKSISELSENFSDRLRVDESIMIKGRKAVTHERMLDTGKKWTVQVIVFWCSACSCARWSSLKSKRTKWMANSI